MTINNYDIVELTGVEIEAVAGGRRSDCDEREERHNDRCDDRRDDRCYDKRDDRCDDVRDINGVSVFSKTLSPRW